MDEEQESGVAVRDRIVSTATSQFHNHTQSFFTCLRNVWIGTVYQICFIIELRLNKCIVGGSSLSKTQGAYPFWEIPISSSATTPISLLLTPEFPTSTRGCSRDFIQSWKICCPWVFHFNLEKQSSFVMGMYPIRTVARAEGERHVDFSMFSIVKYTGHADLSPLKLESSVLSDAMITGAMSHLEMVMR